jgi:hypothetical protein
LRRASALRSLLGLAALLAPARAAAQATPGTLDLYQGTVVGSPRIVAMGGTAAAVAEDATGTLATPASVAFRPVGSTGSWDWDFYLDALASSRATDLSNSGLAADSTRAVRAFAGGLFFYFGRWGVGLSASGVEYALPPAAGATAPLTLTAQSSQLTLGRSLLGGRLGLGGSVIGGEFVVKEGAAALFDLAGAAAGVGLLWRPLSMPWRLGLAGQLPALTSAVSNNCATPTDCGGLMPPARAQNPWEVRTGIAWRFGSTPWNDPNPVLFRDERAVVVAADVALVGGVGDGISVAGFAAQTTQPSGRSANLSARIGVETELLPGRLRIRAGSYWEPGRIAGRQGRVHGTTGIELLLFRFNFRERERRVRLALAADVAVRYQNIALSIGFWH